MYISTDCMQPSCLGAAIVLQAKAVPSLGQKHVLSMSMKKHDAGQVSEVRVSMTDEFHVLMMCLAAAIDSHGCCVVC